MVMRAYPIRVGGTSGPMAIPIDFKIIADRTEISEAEVKRIEVGTVSGKQRRIAEFDWDQVRRAASINGITDIALTFADYLDVGNRDARRFDQLTPGRVDGGDVLRPALSGFRIDSRDDEQTIETRIGLRKALGPIVVTESSLSRPSGDSFGRARDSHDLVPVDALRQFRNDGPAKMAACATHTDFHVDLQNFCGQPCSLFATSAILRPW
jgi:Adenylosuccinate synthetase